MSKCKDNLKYLITLINNTLNVSPTVHRGDGESTSEVNKLLRIVFFKSQLLTLKKSYMLGSI